MSQVRTQRPSLRPGRVATGQGLGGWRYSASCPASWSSCSPEMAQVAHAVCKCRALVSAWETGKGPAKTKDEVEGAQNRAWLLPATACCFKREGSCLNLESYLHFSCCFSSTVRSSARVLPNPGTLQVRGWNQVEGLKCLLSYAHCSHRCAGILTGPVTAMV